MSCVLPGTVRSEQSAKLERAVAAGLFERLQGGDLYLPVPGSEPWLEAYESEMTSWRGQVHETNDQVDVTSSRKATRPNLQKASGRKDFAITMGGEFGRRDALAFVLRALVMSDTTTNTATSVPTAATADLLCGLVMPISTMGECTAQHWAEVKAILAQAIRSIAAPRFRVELVSDADDVGVIQKRIVHNLYDAPIVVCDVSQKNANVMFELGMRLAFDKPTVVVKDDKTDYSFDTSPLEHLTYPRDLRYASIVKFQETLAEKVRATSERSQDPTAPTFLKSFGTFNVVKLDEQETTANRVVMEELKEITRQLARMEREQEQGKKRKSVSGASSPSDRMGRERAVECAGTYRHMGFLKVETFQRLIQQHDLSPALAAQVVDEVWADDKPEA